MTVTLNSGCKINLLLNILGKRPDDFHELETVLQPIALHDEISFRKSSAGISLRCDNPALPLDGTNLIHRAATEFLKSANLQSGVEIQLIKKIPIAAGLGGGSGNAATTLLGLNELFDHPLALSQLHKLAAAIGSDVPFFLQSQPALASGRGETIQPLALFPALHGVWALLINPGFGISTVWAYQSLARFPGAINSRVHRAHELIGLLQNGNLTEAGASFYNTLEIPVLEKYPILKLFQEFLREHGAKVTLMSGSGSTTFALMPSEDEANELRNRFNAQFGSQNWTALVPI